MKFFDSYAIIEIIKGRPNYEKYKEETFLTNSLNLSEVTYFLLREIHEKEIKKILNKLNFVIIEINENIAIESAIFRYKNKERKLSYADCIGYITAIKNNLVFLTGDKEFEEFKNVEFVK